MKNPVIFFSYRVIGSQSRALLVEPDFFITHWLAITHKDQILIWAERKQAEANGNNGRHSPSCKLYHYLRQGGHV